MSVLIDRQQAVDAICKSGLEKERNGQLVMTMCEAKQWAVDTIEQLPPAEQPADNVSKTAIIAALHDSFADGFNTDRWWNSTHVLAAINKAKPAGHPEQR